MHVKKLARVLISFLGSFGALFAFAESRWRSETARLIGRVKRLKSGSPSERFAAPELEGLPAPVVRYLRAALREGQPMIRYARLEQKGEFLVRPERNDWRPFAAIEHFAARPARFVWDARIRIAPGVAVRVRDGFVDGAGFMRASLMGLVPIVSVEGTPEIAAAALQRYLAEAAWCPTALLSSQGVSWTSLDDSSSRATLSVGATTVSVDFRFGADGLVESVFTPARARLVDGRAVATPWQGHFSAYGERGGMLIPLAGEVEWLLPDGPQVYWRGRITNAAYEPER